MKVLVIAFSPFFLRKSHAVGSDIQLGRSYNNCGIRNILLGPWLCSMIFNAKSEVGVVVKVINRWGNCSFWEKTNEQICNGIFSCKQY